MNGMTQNHMAVELLKLTGFPLPNIRLSLHKLTGITQPKIADTIGTPRLNVTNHMSGIRNNKEIQNKIADIFEIPTEVLFEDNIKHDK